MTIIIIYDIYIYEYIMSYHYILHVPLQFRSSESMPLKSNNDGTYVATWVPSESGNYLIQIFIDSCSTGMYLYSIAWCVLCCEMGAST